MQTGISLKAVAGSSTICAKAHKTAPTKGRERRLIEELDKQCWIRFAKFLVERGTKDESSEESDGLPDYKVRHHDQALGLHPTRGNCVFWKQL